MKYLCRTLEDKLSIRKYWAFWILMFLMIGMILFLLVLGDKIYLPVNDNFDYNIAHAKMFRDNRLWQDRQTPVPFLGGVDRSVFISNYNLTNVIYYVFDVQNAYWICHLTAVFFSGGGFFLLGESIRKLTNANLNPNIFCIFGIIYIFIGMWPNTILCAALIPWWVLLAIEIYRTRKISLSFAFFLLVYNISTPLMGIFLFFYTVIFYVGAMIREKKADRVLSGTLGVIIMSVAILDRKLLGFVAKGSEGLIKGLAQNEGYMYTDSVYQCVVTLKKVLQFEGNIYHSGLYVLKYVALPVIVLFFLLFNLEYKATKVNKKFLLAYNCMMIILFINACAYAFDRCYCIRRWVPFASGFSFARFLWLSPFIVMMCIIMILHYLIEKRFIVSAVCIVIAIPFSIIWDPEYDSLGSMYNVLHVNYDIFCQNGEVPETYWRWKDFYAEDLFEVIKNDLSYSGEWSVAYGLDPAVLQYNGIKTLDGYYNNYSSEWKQKWERLIAPVLDMSDSIESYWHESNGIRAYIYSMEWDFPGKHQINEIKAADMLIDSDVFREMRGEYVFSIVEITNAEELGFDYMGEWVDPRGVYDVRVYKMQH